MRQLGTAKVAELIDAIGQVIDAADPAAGLDRDALEERVLPRLGAWARRRTLPMFGDFGAAWTVGVGAAAAQGRLVLGRGARGRTLYLPRVDAPRQVDPDAAVAEVTRRFLHVYGPATHQDVARWFRTTPSGAKG